MTDRATELADAPPFAKRALIPLLFLATGAFALCYEVVWARYLHLFIGHTTQAYTIVLASFMGGQALGYLLIGPYADRVRRPLAVYGAFEMAIGGYALAFPSIYERAGPLFLEEAAARGLLPGSGGLLAAKLLSGALLILPPAVLMGGTLPLVVRARLALGGVAGRTIARLYAVNCAGAVLGTLATAYGLVPAFGSQGTLLLTGLLNAAVGAIAFLAAGAPLPPPEASAAPPEAAPAAAPPASAAGPLGSPRIAFSVALLGCAATGFSAMVYEVAWTRLLAISLGASSTAFSIMLATYIGGIALGARIAGSALAERLPPLRLFGLTQAATALAIGLALPLYDLLPNFTRSTLLLLARSDAAFPLYQVAQVAITALVMLLPATVGGMGLPLAARAIAAHERAIGRSVGHAFAANTLGTLLGAALGGLALLPALGIRHAFSAGALLNALAALAALLATREGAGAPALRRLLPLALVPASFLAALLPGFTRGALTFQTFRRSVSDAGAVSIAEFKEAARSREKAILFDTDGAAATVTVIESSGKRIMLINGKADASTGGDVGVQLLLGHLPLLLKPAAKEVFIVGLGSGMTAGAVLRHPVARVDVCEISPEVVRASRLFDDVSGAPLDDPRVRVIEEDARIALALSGRRYDVVISEPSNPWVAGIGSLFTEEHFRAVHEHLTEGGLALQWFHLYECSDDLVRMVLRTFRKVFPEMRIFTDRLRGDLLLVGTRGRLDVDLAALEARFRVPGVRADLEREGIGEPTTLLSLELFGPLEAARSIGRGPLHRDDRPDLETEGPRALFLGLRADALILAAEDPGRLPPGGDLLLERRLADRPASASETADLARYLSQPGSGAWPSLAPLLLARAEEAPDEASRLRARRGAASLLERPGPGDARPLLRRIAESPSATAEDLRALVEAETRAADRLRVRLRPEIARAAYAPAIEAAELLLARFPEEGATAKALEGRLRARANDLARAAALYDEVRLDERAGTRMRGLAGCEAARVALARGEAARAREDLDAALALAARAALGGEGAEAREVARRVLELDPESADAARLAY